MDSTGIRWVLPAVLAIGLVVAAPDGSAYATLGAHDPTGDDPAVKNAISRADSSARGAPLPLAQAARARASVAAQRAETPPTLRPTYLRRSFHTVPTDRYEMAGGCYDVQDTAGGRWLRLSGSTLKASAYQQTSGLPVFFKATDLGHYLLHVSGHRNLARASAPLASGLVLSPTPDANGDWTVTRTSAGYRFQLPGTGWLRVDSTGTAVLGATPSTFALRRGTGCTAFPEIGTNVTGAPFSGISSFQEVQGYVDAHTHGMAFEFLGGDVHCGRPWSPFGVEVALRDCPDHTATDGKGAALEAVLSGRPTHDPVGWPTFKDWPAPRSLTHEGTYYSWLERSWRGGQRMLVNLLVENDQLCKLYPLKHNSCDDMDSIRLQAKDMRLLERYVDAQSGGPGWGWYRIVTDPAQARATINRGKLAVVMGVETSVPFGCTMKLGVPACDDAQIDAQLDEVHRLGVRQLELVNKFDNALAGVAGDAGTTGTAVNSANFLETGSFWAMQHCAVQDPEVHDQDQITTPDSPATPAQDALFGAVFTLAAPTVPAPVYPSPHHCNALGLSALGEHTIRGIAARKMIFDPDHMSVKARNSSLDLIDTLRYPGVVSSHSWSTPDAYPRIYREGGFITPYAGDSTGFVAKWRRHLAWADPRFAFGFGYGADINGLGAQGDPRPDAATNNPVTYPFTGLGGVRIDKQVSGRRVYDINTDGVAHYGLYPDWIEDLRHVGGDAIVQDLARGSEAYLEMWERAEGVRPDACRNPATAHSVAFLTGQDTGSTTARVLQQVGQPHRRLGTSYTYCAGAPTALHSVRMDFTAGGRLTGVRDLGAI